MDKIYKTFERGNDLLFAIDICGANGRVFVDEMRGIKCSGKWASLAELFSGSWELVFDSESEYGKQTVGGHE